MASPYQDDTNTPLLCGLVPSTGSVSCSVVHLAAYFQPDVHEKAMNAFVFFATLKPGRPAIDRMLSPE